MARCVSCRKAICQECATQWEGINYCVRCLKERRSAASTRSPVLLWLPMTIALAALFYLASYALVWVGAFMRDVF